MASPLLSICSAKAHDLAHRLAAAENASVVEIVERALEAYGDRRTEREPAESFYARMREEEDIDLDAIIRENRCPDPAVDL